MSFYLYAETAFHHQGDKEYLLKLADEARKSGAKGIKFQVLIELNDFMSSKHTAYEEAKNWILSFDEWKEVFQYTKNIGLDIILMPLDVKAFDLIKEFDAKYIEIHSVSFKDEKLLSKLSESNTPLIFGIGGRTQDEIDFIVKKYADRKVTLMVGFQSYPSDLRDIKLERIKELVNRYPNCQIGYADHSSYESEMAIVSNDYAYILGARVFEKHIALEEGVERIDYQSAVSSEKIKNIVKRLGYLENISNIESEKLFEMNEKELVYRNRQKVPVAKRKILAGEAVTSDILELKMINQEDCIDSTDKVVGKKALKDIEIDSAFASEDVV